MRFIVVDVDGKEKKDIAGDADTVGGFHAAATPTANKLLAMNANAKFPTHTVEGTLTVESGLNVGTGQLNAISTTMIPNEAHNMGIFTGLVILELDSNNDDVAVYVCNGAVENSVEIADPSGLFSTGYGSPGDNQIKIHYMTGYCLINRFTVNKTVRYMRLAT